MRLSGPPSTPSGQSIRGFALALIGSHQWTVELVPMSSRGAGKLARTLELQGENKEKERGCHNILDEFLTGT